MAYFRGDHYVFDDGDHVCWWVRGRYDAHRHWGESLGRDGSTGVQVPCDLMDRFVLMRFAEMLVDGSAGALLDEMSIEVSKTGNSGHVQLLGNLDLIRSSIGELEQRVRQATVDDVWGGASN